jgi:hypothetical protein
MSINRRALSLFLQLGSRPFGSQPLGHSVKHYAQKRQFRRKFYTLGLHISLLPQILCTITYVVRKQIQGVWERSRSLLPIASISSSTCSTWVAMRPTLFPEIFVTNYEPKPCNIAEERRCHLQSEGSPKSRKLLLFMARNETVIKRGVFQRQTVGRCVRNVKWQHIDTHRPNSRSVSSKRQVATYRHTQTKQSVGVFEISSGNI